MSIPRDSRDSTTTWRRAGRSAYALILDHMHPGSTTTRIPRPAGMHRLLPLAWLVAQAFTSNRFEAAISTPWTAALLAPGLVRRTVYESKDHDGTVTIARRNPVLDVLLITVFTLVVLASLVYGSAAAGDWFAVVEIVLLLTGLWPMRHYTHSTRPTGPETPPGTRYTISTLAQRPGPECRRFCSPRHSSQACPTAPFWSHALVTTGL